MKTLIEIPDSQIEKLAVVCERMEVSRSEIIREAIEEYLKRHPVYSEAAGEAFGIWKGRNKDGLSYQQKLRDEWN